MHEMYHIGMADCLKAIHSGHILMDWRHAFGSLEPLVFVPRLLGAGCQ